MSHTIIYDKQFVRIPKEVVDSPQDVFIPLVICGDNNVYDSQGKRPRDWDHFPFMVPNNIYGTLDEMLAKAHKDLEDNQTSYSDYSKQHIRDNFGSYVCFRRKQDATCAHFTFENYLSFIKSGVKHALTIEQLLNVGFFLSIGTSPSKWNHDKMEEMGLPARARSERTSKALVDHITVMVNKYKSKGIYLSYELTGIGEENLPKIRKYFFDKPKKEIHITEEYNVAIYSDEEDDTPDGYIKSARGNKIKHVWNPSFAQAYPTKKLAQKVIDRVSERFTDLIFKIHTRKLDEPKLVKI